eukprot:9790570-Karenia_brevis.AAC.1
MQPRDQFTSSMWKHRVDQKPSCKECKPPDVEPTCQCAVCRKELPRTPYHVSQWDHRLNPQRKPTCN